MKKWSKKLEEAMIPTEYDAFELGSILPVQNVEAIFEFESEIKELMQKVDESGFLANVEEMEKFVQSKTLHFIEDALNQMEIDRLDINYLFCKLVEDFHNEYEDEKDFERSI